MAKIINKKTKIKKEATGRVLVASFWQKFGTFSTGVNIKNIHNIILVESYKSDSIIRQSIGRGLRKHGNKDILKIFDIVDDFSYKDKKIDFKNKLLLHAFERIKIYKQQSFDYEIKRLKL